MHISSSTVRCESWQACVLSPSGVEHSSLSTVFDLTLQCLGSWELSALCLLEPGEQPEPPRQPTSVHLLNASSIRGLLLQIAGHPGSLIPTFPVVPRPFLELHASTRLCSAQLVQSISGSRYGYCCTGSGGIVGT